MLRIALIEDDPHYTKILEECLKLQPDISLSFYAPSIEVFFEKLPPRIKFDVILVDVDLPGKSGVEAVPDLRNHFPDSEIIMLTQTEDSDLMIKAIYRGASGYLNKNFNILQLPGMLRTLASGAALLSPTMARKLVQYFQPTQQSQGVNLLSSKEIQLLRLFDQGHSYEEAASIMDLSVDGVRYHVRNIYKKLNTKNKVEAIRIAKDFLWEAENILQHNIFIPNRWKNIKQNLGNPKRHSLWIWWKSLTMLLNEDSYCWSPSTPKSRGAPF